MISKFSVKKPYTVLVGVVMAIILGVVSFTKMTTDLLPNITLPYVIVMTTYVGASPETVEMVVTKPVESSMATVSNIEGISSISSENYSMVILEFAQSADMNAVSLEIRENLDQIKSFWDDSVGNPIIMKLNPDMMPVMVAAVGREGATNAEVSDLAKNTIVPELESIEGVASASAVGLLEESVNVIIRQDKIDKINEQVFGYIDSELEEQEEELADGWKDIEDGWKELQDGRKEIEDGRLDLVDAQKELDESRAELEESRTDLAEGKAELEENKKKIADGKEELEDKQKEATRKLAETETQLLTAKADLEASKINMEMEITTLEKAQEGLGQAKEGLQKALSGKEELQKGIDAIDAILNGMPELEGAISQIDAEIAEGEAKVGNLNDVIAAISSSGASQYEDLPEEIRQAVESAIGYPGDSAAPSEVAGAMSGIKSAAEASLNAAKAQREMLQNQLAALGAQGDAASLQAQRAELEKQLKALEEQIPVIEEQINQLEAAISASTMGMGAEAYLATLQQGMVTIEENIMKVDEGLNQLYKGNLEAAIEIANAKSLLEVGEMQIETAEKQLESGEKQLETGEEQLQSGQEQIDDGFDQLKDALEQLKEGEDQLKEGEEQLEEGAEKLEEARDDAYANADMNDILTVDTVKSLLAAQNFSMPGGYVTEGGMDYLVRVGDKTADIEELAAMPIMNPDMDGVDVITLSDVADVFMTDNSDEIYTNINGSPGILLTIQKQTGYSTGDVSDKLKERFETMMEEDESLSMIILMDQGIYIDMVMDSVISNVLFGAVLAILILILFLKDMRPTLVIALSIPVSLVTAVVCMYFSGITLNIISLSGLALGVGMLVDNSIVVIENIYRMRSEGKGMREASIEGAKEVAGAIMASTLTTVCVFLPIVFTEGITRQLFVDMGLTIAYSLLASLMIALTVVPAMASKILTKTKEQKDDKFFTALIGLYEKVLKASLKVKPLVLAAVLILLVISAMASMSRGTAFMPDMESTEITVTVTMPDGTPLDETGKVTDEIIERIRTIDDVVDVGAMASTSSMALLTGGGNSSKNVTDIYITLKEDKELTGDEIGKKIEELTADLEEAELVINTSSMDMSALGGEGISIQVRGREIDTLQEIAAEIARIVEETEGTTEVSDGMEDSTEELRIIIDRDKAIEHGLTVAQIFQQIQAKLADASSATTLETEIRDYDVYVKNANDIALTRDTIKRIKIDVTTRDGKKEKITLADIADFETKQSPTSVNRADQNRYIGVSASIAEGYNIGLVSQELQKKLDAYEMPDGYTLLMSGENEAIVDAMEQVTLMLVLALLFMYLIMVAQFQSLLSPFIIMFTVPLAFTGGFLGLYITGSEVSVIALIGFVMLSGIIVNNGIVLVDYINQLREAGMEKTEAIVEAGRTRLRPVLMTALTTILALSTMVFSHDMGSEMGKPMAVVSIGGLIYGTLLTLVVVPCIYDIFMREKKD